MHRLSVVLSVLGTGLGCGSVKATQPDAAVSTGDANVTADARAAACGDGMRDPGEVCFGTAILRVANDVTYDAHLADEDGDGDLDLIYLIGDQFKFYVQQGGQFASSDLNGPTTTAEYARSRDLGGTPANRIELIDAGFAGFSTWRRNATNTGYELINTAPAPTGTTLRAFDMGNVTGSALPNPVAVYSSNIVVGTYAANLTLAAVPEMTVQGTQRFMDIGPVDADTFEDVVLAGSIGVLIYRGESGGLQSVTLTPHTSATDAVAIADVDDDNIADIAYAVAGATGTIGVMRGVGAAAFLTPTTKAVPNLGDVLDKADIDGDGHMDIIAARAQTGANAVLVMLGKADGTLADPVALPVAAPVDYLHCDTDFNGDGAPDCVTTDWNGQNMVILPSNP